MHERRDIRTEREALLLRLVAGVLVNFEKKWNLDREPRGRGEDKRIIMEKKASVVFQGRRGGEGGAARIKKIRKTQSSDPRRHVPDLVLKPGRSELP